MKLSEIAVGMRLAYYPPQQDVADIRHFPAVVEAIKKRVKVKIFMEGAEQGISKFVSAKRLNFQQELNI